MDSEEYNVPEAQDDVLLDGPADGGQAEGDEANQVEELVLPLDQYGNYKIPVKVDGQEEFVPLAEAREGYQRQADYTRKTQELATQRNDLGWAAAMKAALDQDPQGTLALLGAHYGVQPQVPVQPATRQSVDPFDDWLSNDEGWQQQAPIDPRVSAIEQRLMQYEQAAQEQQLRDTISRLQATYPDFDATQVVAAAVRSGSADLEAVYKQMTYDNLMHRNGQLTQQLQQLEQRTQAKQQSSFVTGGSSASPAGADPVGEITNIRDAWFAAKRELSK